MTDAPERIWAAATKWAVGHGPELDWRFGRWKEAPATVPDPKQEYIRADTALALVAEAYEAAWRAAFRACNAKEAGYIDENNRMAARIERELKLEIVKAIKSCAPSDALAVRGADRKRVRDEALREAAAKLKAHAPHLVDGPEHDVGSHYGYHIALDRILDLIEGDQTDEE